MKSYTFGNLPSFEEFDKEFTRLCGYKNYTISNHAFSGEYDAHELYNLLKMLVNKSQVMEIFSKSDDSLDFVSSVLFTLGFEWV